MPIGGGQVVFKRSASVPYGMEAVTVPCGQCIGCRLERSRQWAVRCVHEAQLHEHSCFITLTYDDEHLPVVGDGGKVKDRPSTLVKDDFQRFMKRLRKAISPTKIRFFHSGEYGEKGSRAHYHAIIFGYDFPDKYLFKSSGKVKVYRSPLLESLWTDGYSSVGDCTFETAAYVARYVLKKVNGERKSAHYGDRLPEYTTMSRRPGIAAGWYDRYAKTDVYPSDEIVIRSRKMKPPRFYDERLKLENKEMFNYIKSCRREMAILHEDEATPERLAVKEIVAKAKLKLAEKYKFC